jgi:hypothetical protein
MERVERVRINHFLAIAPIESFNSGVLFGFVGWMISSRWPLRRHRMAILSEKNLGPLSQRIERHPEALIRHSRDERGELCNHVGVSVPSLQRWSVLRHPRNGLDVARVPYGKSAPLHHIAITCCFSGGATACD